MRPLPVSEIFGPVVQGEGRHIGTPSTFLRLGLCNLSCVWCDTPYTWDRSRFNLDKECPPRTAEWIIRNLPDPDPVSLLHTTTLVISGGEPLMHRDNDTLMAVLDYWRGPAHMETNGTLTPRPWMGKRIEWWSVSPKLSHSGDRESKRLHPDVLDLFTALAWEDRAGFKFVATGPQDLDEIDGIVSNLNLLPKHVWIMPEGISAESQMDGLRSLESDVLARRWNLAPRLHVLMHGNRRGT